LYTKTKNATNKTTAQNAKKTTNGIKSQGTGVCLRDHNQKPQDRHTNSFSSSRHFNSLDAFLSLPCKP
jgi:hypothetical protein